MINYKSFKEVLGLINDPDLRRQYRAKNPVSYDEFVSSVNKVIDEVVQRLQDRRHTFNLKNVDSGSLEDHISQTIVSEIQAGKYGYDVSSGKIYAGSTDITVSIKTRKGEVYTWIGEAKRYKEGDIKNSAFEGILQLVTRYADGMTNNTSGGLLLYFTNAYIDKKTIKECMSEWEQYMNTNYLEFSQSNIQQVPCGTGNQLAFETVLKHKGSGLDYTVRHIPRNLLFKPQDKSGRTAKRYNS